MNKKSNINLLYLSSSSPENKRGIPFLENRFNILSQYNIVDKIRYFKSKDTFILRSFKGVKSSYRNEMKQPNFLNKKIWKPIKFRNFIFNPIIFRISDHFYIHQLTNVMNKEIKKDKYDLAHCHWAFPSGVVLSELKKKMDIPYVLTLHGGDIHQLNNQTKTIRRMTLQALENADKCIFVSYKLKEEALKYNYSGHNAVVIPNGFDDSIFYFKDKKSSKDKLRVKAARVVGFVGNLIDVKNVLLLPHIFKNIKEKYSNVEFVIVGDGNLKQELINHLDVNNIKVTFTGIVDQKEVADYMRAMDVLILPSKNEGWGCVITEAHACGTYVTGSDRGGIPEAIGDFGKTFSLNDDFVKNISNHIVKILNEGYNIESIVKYSRKYMWINTMDKEMELYEEVLKETIK